MQNPREVVNQLLSPQGHPERVGLIEGPWADTVANWVRDGYPTRMVHKKKGDDIWRRSDGMSVEAPADGEYEEPLPVWQHFGFDMVGAGGWFDIMPLIDYEELLEETDEWTVKRNGAGAALKYWKHKSGTPEHMDFLMTTREIWERDYRSHLVEWDPARVTNLADQQRSFQEAKADDRWAFFGHMFIWESMRQSMGDITLYESMVLDPDWIHDYNRVYTDLYKNAFQYLFDNVGMPDGIWIYEDMGYKNGLFASPKQLGALIFPYYAEMVEFFHQKELPVVLHTCGTTAEAMPLIVEAKFDAVNPMERKAKGNDPFVFAEKYGDKLAFVGGLDARIIESNDRDLIRREVIDYVEGMKARDARLVFASDHSLSTHVRYDTYQYVVDVYREVMYY